MPVCNLFVMAQQLLLGQGLIIIEFSRIHSYTPHSLGPLWTSDLYLTIHNNRQYIHVPGGIRIHNPSMQAAADPLLGLRSQWDRDRVLILQFIALLENNGLKCWIQRDSCFETFGFIL